ncbi:MAG: response regulator [Planctomycetaceae bacterium]|nr:response regulator [Planctomycetaceae bacterium]
MRILIVDDDGITRDLLRDVLQGAGFDVVEAGTAEEALGVLRADDVRMVITDWEMPGMGGLELCRTIRRREFTSYVYVILLTSRCSRLEAVEGMTAGADDFVAKPFHKGELLARVRAGERVLSLENREMVILALAKLAASRDSEGGQHLERLRRYARILAEALGRHPEYQQRVDAELVSLVYQTAPLHDIGKVGVPDAILLKQGKLTEEEFALMQTHTLIGAETLDAALRNYPSARFLQVARDIALSHHERWDGQGYPHGLSGEQIPLAARIVALADVYDALTSPRSYREPGSHATACEIIAGEAGKHFDPAVVVAFQQVAASFAEIQQQFADDVQPAEPPGAVVSFA